MASTRKGALLQGALDMLVLQVLAGGPRHGYGIARRIETEGEDALKVEEGSLYPALHRMEQKGWIQAEWGKTERNRRARIYRLTVAGQEQLRAEVDSWLGFSAAVTKMVEPA